MPWKNLPLLLLIYHDLRKYSNLEFYCSYRCYQQLPFFTMATSSLPLNVTSLLPLRVIFSTGNKKGSKDFQICPSVRNWTKFSQVANCFTDQKSSVTAQLRCIYSAMAMFLPINLLICCANQGMNRSLSHMANLFLAIKE